jgi:benzoate/toluate 1,2-dioxygenase alpha subunit
VSTMLEASPSAAEKLGKIREGLDNWLVKDPESGHFKLDREVFTDADLFELEMKHIFERNWIFLGHESQVPKPNDFMTAYIGRQPVLISRTRSGELKCFINACSHRGARICRERAGNKKNFTCPFHGWTYSTAGELLDVTDQAQGGYLPTFDKADYGLEQIGRLETYRGFMFGSLSADVVPLEDYLAGAKTMIDLMIDQSPAGGWEVLRGATRYTYKGNWKLQAENGLDGYHIGNVHASYFMTVQRRFDGKSTNDTKAFDFGTWDKLEGGSFSFHNGHSVLWNDYANYQDRPNYELLDWFKQKFGADQAKWMNGRIRNLLLFPNVFLMDQTSTQIRILRPISVDETEVITYCIAPVGESAKARALRIRQYEDFFNASGMATPDDLTEFNNCQIGFGHGPGRYNDMSRGASRFVRGANDHGKAINLDVVMSGEAVADEGLYVAIHEDWVSRMKAAVNEEMNELAEAAE